MLADARIKWVTHEEYTRLRKELEAKTVWPSGWNSATSTEMGFIELYDWDEVSRQQVLIKVAETELMKELL